MQNKREEQYLFLKFHFSLTCYKELGPVYMAVGDPSPQVGEVTRLGGVTRLCL